MTVIIDHAIAGAAGEHSETRLDVSGKMASLVAKIGQWNDRQRQRQALLDLDSRLLQDIGVTVAQARSETDKRFWK
jgi:uncharacterized protein YjiS (DUF1127 family)